MFKVINSSLRYSINFLKSVFLFSCGNISLQFMTDLKIKCLAHLPELTISPDKSAKANELIHSSSSEIQIFTLVSHSCSWAMQTLSSAKRTKEWRPGRFSLSWQQPLKRQDLNKSLLLAVTFTKPFSTSSLSTRAPQQHF